MTGKRDTREPGKRPRLSLFWHMAKLSFRNEVKKLDRVFSQWLRHSHADDNGLVECFTCRTKKPINEMQAGHFMSRSHYSVRWTVGNVMPQCPSCNLFHAGRQYEFGKRLDQDFGEGMAEGLVKRSKLPGGHTAHGLKEIREQLQEELNEMRR